MNFANELWLKTLRCSQVYDKYVVKGIFAEGLLPHIRYSRRAY